MGELAELVAICFSPCAKFLGSLEVQGDTSVVTKWTLADNESVEGVRLHVFQKKVFPGRTSNIGLSANGERVFVALDASETDLFVIEGRVAPFLEAARIRAGRKLTEEEKKQFDIDFVDTDDAK